MWVPSTQGFTDPQGIQAETTGTCKVCKDREEGLESQSFQLPPVLSSCLHKQQLLPQKSNISSSFWEKGTSKPALVPLQREHKAFGQRNYKGKVDFEHLEAPKLVFF